jgi:hypothetical protein
MRLKSVCAQEQSLCLCVILYTLFWYRIQHIIGTFSLVPSASKCLPTNILWSFRLLRSDAEVTSQSSVGAQASVKELEMWQNKNVQGIVEFRFCEKLVDAKLYWSFLVTCFKNPIPLFPALLATPCNSHSLKIASLNHHVINQVPYTVKVFPYITWLFVHTAWPFNSKDTSPELHEVGVRGKTSHNIKIEVGHGGNGFLDVGRK